MNRVATVLIILWIGLLTACNNSQSPIEGTLPESFTLTTTVSPEEAGEVSPNGGEYLSGSSIELRASPADNYVFERWGGDLEGENNPMAVTIRRNLEVTAYFTERDYDLIVEIVGEGAVREEVIDQEEREPDKQVSSTSGEASVTAITGEREIGLERPSPREGGEIHVEADHSVPESIRAASNMITTVRLTAEPAEGWIFVRWEGDLEGDENPAELVIDEPKRVTAVFEEDEAEGFALNISVEGEGSVEADPDRERYDPDEEVTLTATPDEGWVFARWEGDLNGDENPVDITMDSNKQITAVFEEEEPQDFSLSVSVDGEGSVEISPEQDRYEPGEEVTLTASPDEGWVFSRWQGDLSGSENPESLVMDENKSVTAVFSREEAPEASIDQQPEDTRAGETLDPAPAIRITSADGDPVSGLSVSVSLNQNEFMSGSTLSATTNNQGVAAFDDLAISEADTGYRIIFDVDHNEVSDLESSSFDVTAADADASASSADVPDEGEAGEETEITITLRDAFGNRAAGQASAISIEVTGANSASPDAEESSTSGDYRAVYTPESSGTDNISISVNGDEIDGSPFESEVQSGGIISLGIIDIDNPQRAGEPFGITVRALDAAGNLVTGFGGSAELSTNAGDISPNTLDFQNGVGEADVTVTEAGGNKTITVTVNGISTTSNTFAVNAGQASVILIESGNNQIGSILEVLSDPLVVLVTDDYENPVPDESVSFQVEDFPDGANDYELSATSATTNSNGLAQSRFTLGDRPGTYEIEASIGDDEVIFTAEAEAGPPGQITILEQPDDTEAGEEIDPAPVVQVEDAAGNRLSGIEVSVSLQGGSFSAGTTTRNTDDNGEAVFPGLVIEEVGSYTLVFEAGDEEQESDEFDVTAASASNIEIVDGDGQTGKVGQSLDSPLQVRVTDTFGNLVEGENVNFSVTPDGSGAEVNPVIDNTDASGITSTELTLGTTPGLYEVTASIGTGGPATFEATAEAGDPVSIRVDQQPPDTPEGEQLDPAPSVEVFDEFDNPVEGVDIRVSINTGGNFASGSTTVVATGADGVARFGNLVINESGPHNLRFEVVGNTGLSVTSDQFFVTSPEANLILESGDNQQGRVGVELNSAFVVRVEDNFENPVEGRNVVFSIVDYPFDGGQGVLSNNDMLTNASGTASTVLTFGHRPGEYRVEAEIDGAEPVIILATGLPGPPASVYINQQPQSGTAGEVISPAPEVLVEDEFGNALDNQPVAVSLDQGSFASGSEMKQTNSSGRAEFGDLLIEQAGEYRMIFASESTLSESDLFEVGAAAAMHLVFVDGDNQTGSVLEELPDPFIVRVTDQFDNPVDGETVGFEITAAPENAQGQELRIENATTLEVGESRAWLTLGDVVGEYEVRASWNGDSVNFMANAIAGI
jgi:hypothetical protein